MPDREQNVEAARSALSKRWTTSPDGRRTDLEVPGVGSIIRGGRVQSRIGVRFESNDDGVKLTVSAVNGEPLTVALYRERGLLLAGKDLLAGAMRPVSGFLNGFGDMGEVFGMGGDFGD